MLVHGGGDCDLSTKKSPMPGIEPMQGTQGMLVHGGGDKTFSAKKVIHTGNAGNVGTWQL